MGAAVISTEWGLAVRYLQENFDANKVTVDINKSKMSSGRVKCRELDWYKTSDRLQTLFAPDETAVFDLIVVTDCSLSTKDSKGVLEMIHKYGTKRHTKAIVGVCNEREGTPYFIENAKKDFRDVVLVPTSDLHPDNKTTRHTILKFQV